LKTVAGLDVAHKMITRYEILHLLHCNKILLGI